MNQIDKIAYSSRIARLDPKGKLCFSLFPLCLCIGTRSIAAGLITLFAMAALTCMLTGLTLKRYLHFLLIPCGFLLIGTLTIFISRYPAGEPLLAGVTIGQYQYGISPDSLFQGIRLCSTALGAVCCMYFLSFNTPMTSLFQCLRGSPLPGVLVSLMELIYRYIFVIWEEAARMKTAQEARLGYRGLRQSIQSAGTLIGTLFFRAYSRCGRICAALEARGFEGDLHAVQATYAPSKKWYGYTLAFCLVLGAAALAEFMLRRKLG